MIIKFLAQLPGNEWSLVAVLEVWHTHTLINFGQIKFLAPLPGIDLKVNLNINIPTKENLLIWTFFSVLLKILENLQK